MEFNQIKKWFSRNLKILFVGQSVLMPVIVYILAVVRPL